MGDPIPSMPSVWVTIPEDLLGWCTNFYHVQCSQDTTNEPHFLDISAFGGRGTTDHVSAQFSKDLLSLTILHVGRAYLEGSCVPAVPTRAQLGLAHPTWPPTHDWYLRWRGLARALLTWLVVRSSVVSGKPFYMAA